jgi:hypothetical protein
VEIIHNRGETLMKCSVKMSHESAHKKMTQFLQPAEGNPLDVNNRPAGGLEEENA